MPHQCLKCGKVFEEGSAELLRGCPGCQGNRFFFTKQPLDEQQRNVILTEIDQENITSQITELIGGQNREILDKAGNWVTVKPREIRELVEQLHEAKKTSDTQEKRDVLDDEYRKARLEQLKAEIETHDVPETIDVERPGTYKIDVKGLLEQEPVIINRDGSYTIHLPSIFKMLEKGKK